MLNTKVDFTAIWDSAKSSIHGRPSFTWVMSLIGLGSFTILIWCYDIVDGTLVQEIVLNLLYVVFPIGFYKGYFDTEDESRLVTYGHNALAFLLVAGLLLKTAEQFESVSLGFNVAMVIVSFPFLFLLWLLLKRSSMLWVGAAPTLIIAIWYIAVWTLPGEQRWAYLLFSMPVVSIGCFIWTLFTWLLLVCAKRQQFHRRLGPLFEALTMFFLLVPGVLLLVLIVGEITEDPSWMTVTGVILSILFGSVIAVPVRELMLELGNLAPRAGNRGNRY